jgi:tRNA (pseudouridine54-N1)-methyltransferase
MRQFVVLGHTASTEPELPLDDLPGAGGRFDVLCRAVNAAFPLSHAIREDVRCQLVLQDRLTIRLEGSELRYLSPDERNIASLLLKALQKADAVVGAQEVESTPGIYVSKRGFESILATTEGTVIHLHVDGEPLPEAGVPDDPIFVLSDHEPFTDAETAVLADQADARVSVGPERIHGNHAITIVHNYLDTDGYTRYDG